MDFMTFTLNTPMFDFLVLSIIAEGDAYGYQISQIIKRVSDTKDSALYPILKKLQENGYRAWPSFCILGRRFLI